MVSTVDDGLKKNPRFFDNINFDICEVVVIQQLINSNEALHLDNPAKIFSYREKGLSKSRNRAMEKASGNIALIADDDVQFIKGFEKIILDAYQQKNDSYIITFQAMNTQGKPFKNYAKNSFRHNWRSVLKVSSIEITINLTRIEHRKLYDENYGLGAPCRVGEEIILLLDALKQRFKIYYTAKPIVIHPPVSSGRIHDEKITFDRGVMYRRCFGWMSFPMSLAFAIKKHREYRDTLSFIKFLYLMWKGCLIKL